MKVQGPPKPRLQPMRDATPAKEAQAQRAEPSRRERVEVSSSSKLLAQARSPHTPDTARIERLKNAIKDGSFKVDANRVAEAMIQEET
jgi:negative regulator of flagellin synthesis FlgM